MKIAIIPGQFLVGPHTFILEQIYGLIDNGYDVDIITISPIKKEFVTKKVNEYKILDKVYNINIPQKKLKRVAVAIRIIVNNCTKNIIKVFKTLNIFNYGMEALKFRDLFVLNYFLQKYYDIVHCHFGHVARRYVFLKKIFPQIKFIATFHGYDFSAYPKKYGKNIYRELFRNADLITMGSNYAKERLIELGANKNKLLLHPMGIDIRNFTYKPRIWNWGEPFRIISIGRLYEKKGIEYGIMSLYKVLQFYPNVEYHIVGEGPLMPKVSNLIKDLQLNDKVVLYGWVKNDEIPQILEKAHLFIMPSVTASNGDVESQPLVLQEAQAAGLPVIATTHNGLPEGMVNNVSGFLVPERNVDELAEKIKYFIKNSELLIKMGIEGRKFVEENFDMKKLSKKLSVIYDQLVSS